jgi:hypothetical protein
MRESIAAYVPPAYKAKALFAPAPAAGETRQKVHCPAVAYSFSNEQSRKEAYDSGFIPRGAAYYLGSDGNTVHFAGTDRTVSREEYYRGMPANPPVAAVSDRGATGAPLNPEEVQRQLAAWNHDLEVQSARESSPFSLRGFLYSKAGRAAMGITEPFVGLGQILTSGTRWLTSAGGLLPNALSRGIGSLEEGVNDTAARLAQAQQIARDAAGLRKDQWDWWSIGGNIASPANWIPVGRALKGLKWAGEAFPAVSRWINNIFTRGAVAGGVIGTLKPTPDGTQPEARLSNAGEGALTGTVLGPVFERIVAPVAAKVAQRLVNAVQSMFDRGSPAGAAMDMQLLRNKLGRRHPLNSDAIPRAGSRPLVNQGNAPTCGHNSCGMVLNSLGKPVDVATLIQKIPPRADGITTLEIAALLKSQGIRASAYRGRSVADLARYTKDGTPVIVRIADKTPGAKFSHAVVVDGVAVRSGVPVVAIRDPHGMQYFSPVETFKRSFTGDVIVPAKP